MREDLIGALKNAIEHGSTQQQAAKSLINSGYNQTEVNQALSFINNGVLSSLSPQNINNNQKTPIQSPPRQVNIPSNQIQNNKPQSQQLQNFQQNKQKNNLKKGTIKTLILFLILIILLGSLSAAIFFKEEILGFFS